MQDNSKTLCSAAWSDLNVDFANRTIKHCCMMRNESFPDVPYKEMWNNSPAIQKARTELLAGIQTSACSYCWKNINPSTGNYRDIKNKWKSINDFDERIKIIELTLDNLCDMSCIYCFEDTSSRIAQEKNLPDAIKLKPDESFIDSFIEFLVELTKKQTVSLSFSGGEITYSKNFFSFIKKLLSIPELTDRRLHISVISNCNSLRKKQKEMLNLLDLFPETWEFNIAISNESKGTVAELVRYGLSWDRFAYNFESYMSHPRINYVVLAPAFSIFTVKNMYNYFEYVFAEAEKHKNKVTLSMYGNWIQSPTELDPARLPESYRFYVDRTIELFHQYQHLFKDNFEFSIRGLTVLKNRIGTSHIDTKALKQWLFDAAEQKKDDRILMLTNLM